MHLVCNFAVEFQCNRAVWRTGKTPLEVRVETEGLGARGNAVYHFELRVARHFRNASSGFSDLEVRTPERTRRLVMGRNVLEAQFLAIVVRAGARSGRGE